MNKNYKVCKVCGNKVFYKNSSPGYIKKMEDIPCRECKGKQHSEKMKGRTRHFTQEWKDNLRNSLQNSKAWHESMNSDEYKKIQRESKLGVKNGMYGKNHTETVKQKLRELNTGRKHTEETKLKISKIVKGRKDSEYTKSLKRKNRMEQMKKSGQFPSYNKEACSFFNLLTESTDISGVHAMNGGEHEVCGYWVDFYDIENNIVIEWDEERHFDSNVVIKKDIIRQNNIISEINCEFYRIREKTGEVMTINGNQDTANILNELWKKQKNEE